MTGESTQTHDRIDGRQMIDWAVNQYNSGVNSEGLHEILAIHHATQQLLESRTMGNNGRFRVDDAGFLATTANGDFMRSYIRGFLQNGGTVPKLQQDETGKLVSFGSMRVTERDMDFDLVATTSRDGTAYATFQWFREPTATELETKPAETLPKKKTKRERLINTALVAGFAGGITLFALGLNTFISAEGTLSVHGSSVDDSLSSSAMSNDQQAGYNMMAVSTLILATETAVLAVIGRKEELDRDKISSPK